MKLEEVKLAISTGRIRLARGDRFRYYFPVFLVAGLLSAFIYFMLWSFDASSARWIALIPFIGAFGIAFSLRSQLRFVRIATGLSKNAVRTAAQEVIKREGWKVTKRTKRLLICVTGRYHIVTIIIGDREVLVSSRSDSDIGWAYLAESGKNVSMVASHVSRSALNPGLASMK